MYFPLPPVAYLYPQIRRELLMNVMFAHKPGKGR
jgi:hypothetical protein